MSVTPREGDTVSRKPKSEDVNLLRFHRAVGYFLKRRGWRILSSSRIAVERRPGRTKILGCFWNEYNLIVEFTGMQPKRTRTEVKL
mgnify:CR=1 FL=1